MSCDTEILASNARTDNQVLKVNIQNNYEKGEHEKLKKSTLENEGQLTTLGKERNGSFTHRVHETTGGVVYDKQRMYINFYHYNMLGPGPNENYTCCFCDEKIIGMEECRKHVVTERHKVCLKSQAYVVKFLNNIIRRLSNTSFHCGICNITILKRNLNDHIEKDIKHATLKKFGEACARKHLNLLEDSDLEKLQSVEVDIRSTKVLLSQRSWHMYSEFPRKFFCFLCEVDSNIEGLQDHLKISEHLTRLGKCQILPEYGSAVVRNFDQNYHHCGICNSYIYIDDIENHSENLNHKSNILKPLPMREPSRSGEDDEAQLDEESRDGKRKAQIVFKINEKVVVKLDGRFICLDVFSYNTVIKVKDFFHCVSCDKDLREFELHMHINKVEHRMALNDTEIVHDCSQNFIRKIQRSWSTYAHCAVCNVCIASTNKCIRKHFKSKLHKKKFKTNNLTLFRTTLDIAQNIQEMEILGQSYNLQLYDYNAWEIIGLWERHYHCCFVCQQILKAEDIHKHTRATEHRDNQKKCIVLESYGTHYLKIINWTHYVYCTFCNQKIDFVNIDSHIQSDVHIFKQKLALNLFIVDNEESTRDLESEIQAEEKKTIDLINEKYHELSLEIRQSSNVLQPKTDKLINNEIRIDDNEMECVLKSKKVNKGIENKQLKSGNFIQQKANKTQDLGDNVHLLETRKVNTEVIGSERTETGNCDMENEIKSQNSEVLETGIDTNIKLDTSEHIILEVSKKRILTTHSAWNTIAKNTYCCLCKVYFINDVQKHCVDRLHCKRAHMNISDYPDGSVVRKISKNVIQCLVCDIVAPWDLHVQSGDHRQKLAHATLSASRLIEQQQRRNQNSQQTELVNALKPKTVSVRGINTNILGERCGNITGNFYIVQIRNAKVLVAHDSWNCIYEETNACLLCNSYGTNFFVENITEHCNGNEHKKFMMERAVNADFVRKLTRLKLFCLLCNFLGRKSKIKKHVNSSEHFDNLKVAMMQARNAVRSGLKIVISKQANQENSAFKTRDTQSTQVNKPDEILSNVETSIDNEEYNLIKSGSDTDNFQDIKEPAEHRYHAIPTTSRGYRRAVLSEVNFEPELKTGTIKPIYSALVVVEKDGNTGNTSIKDSTLVVVEKDVDTGNTSVKDNALVVVEKDGYTGNTSIKDNTLVVEKDGYTENTSVKDNALVVVEKDGYTGNTSIKDNTLVVEKDGYTENTSVKDNALVVIEKDGYTGNTSIKDNTLVVEKDGYTRNTSVKDNALIVEKYGHTGNTSVKDNTLVVEKEGHTGSTSDKSFVEDKLKKKSEIISVNGIDTNKINVEHCHICKSTVPMQFINEHVESLYHKQMSKLVDVVFERLKNRVFDIPTQMNDSVIGRNVKYCTVCNCILEIDELSKHKDSVLHIDNERNINIMHQLLNVLESKDIQCGSNNLREKDPGVPKTVDVNNENRMENINKTEKFEMNDNSKNVDRTKNFIAPVENSDITKDRDDEKTPFYDEQATIITDSHVTIHMDDVQLRIDTLSYHCVYFVSEYSFWCDLCDVNENGLDIHFKNVKHVKRLREVKFVGFDLIRQLSEQYFHCALCHLLLHVKRLKDHLDTERHKTNFTTARIIHVQDDHGTNVKPRNIEDLQNQKGLEWSRKRDPIESNRKRKKADWNVMGTEHDIFFQPKRSKPEDETQNASENNIATTSNAAAAGTSQPMDRGKVYVTETTEGVLLGVGDKTMRVTSHAFHGIFTDTDGELHCVLCEDGPPIYDDHVYSNKHRKRVAGLEFSGVDLIRCIDNSLAHCGLCNLPLKMAKVEDHVASEVHEENLKASTLIPSTALREDCGRPELIEAAEEHTESLISGMRCSNDDDEDQNQTTHCCGICDLEVMANDDDFIVHYLSSAHKANMKNPSLVIRSKLGERAISFCHLCQVDLPSFDRKLIHTRSSKHIAYLNYFLKLDSIKLRKIVEKTRNKKKNTT